MRRLLSIATQGRGLYEITPKLSDWLTEQAHEDGMLHLFVRHTSASLLIQENADPDVCRDLLAFFNRFAPDADDASMSYLRHRAEGPDDMPAHIKAAVLPVSLTIPVAQGRMLLGTWQGVYVFEHRDAPHRRDIVATLL